MRRRTFIASGLCAGLLVLAAAGAARAQTVNVQIINVCDDSGANCALSNQYASLGYDPGAVQRIFDQAGITVNLLAPKQLNSSTYLNPQVIDDPAHGYLTGSPTDPAHQLLSLAGHGQNTDPNVLNVFAVNTLPHVTDVNGMSVAASTLFGLGLQNSNGAIITTGLAAGNYVAGIDNLAHELGHNLGLLHVDGTPDTSPNNLMQGIGRNVPRTVCGINGIPCDADGNVLAPGAGIAAATTGTKDVLTASQVARVRSAAADLFNADGASAFAETSQPTYYESCSTGVGACTIGIGVNGNASSSLVSATIRFRRLSTDPSVPDLELGLILPQIVAACDTRFATNRLPGGDVEISASFRPGCFTGPLDLGPDGTGVGGDLYSNLFYLSVVDPNWAGNFETITPDYDLMPFSIQFGFSDGLTTTSLFDSSGNASSLNAVAIGNSLNPATNGPGLFVPTDPVLFNQVSVPDDDATLRVLANGDVVAITDVPEPSSLAVFAAGLAALYRPLRARRTRARCGR